MQKFLGQTIDVTWPIHLGVWKSGGARSNLVGIIYPPDWDRVNWSSQKLNGGGGGGACPPPRFLRSCDMAHSSWGLRSFVLFKGEYKWLAYSTLCPVIWEAKRTIFKMHSATLWLDFPNLVQKILGITLVPVFTPADTNQLLGFDCGNELVSKCEFN